MPTSHSFVSAKSDGGDSTLVRPSDWNAEHLGAGFVSISCAAQAKMQYNTATNYQDSGVVGDFSNFGNQNLMQFSLSGLTTITKAWLQFVVLDWNGCMGQNEGVNECLRVWRMLRADINYSQVTWFIYKTGSNWGTNGGLNTSTDRADAGAGQTPQYPGTQYAHVTSGATVDRREIDVTEIVRAAVGLSQSNVDIMLAATETSGHNALTIASRTDGTTAYRPVLLVA